MEVTVVHPFLPGVCHVVVGEDCDLSALLDSVGTEFGLERGAFDVAVHAEGDALEASGLLGISNGDTLHVIESARYRARQTLTEKNMTECTDLCGSVWEGRLDLYTLHCDAQYFDVTTVSDMHGCTLLHISCLMGHLEIAVDLLRRGALVDAGDDKGTTPLLAAAWNGRDTVVALLISHGADLNASAYCGRCETPIFVAALKGRTGIVRQLLEAGADHRKPSEKTTPLQIAQERSHVEVASLLQSAETAYLASLSAPHRFYETAAPYCMAILPTTVALTGFAVGWWGLHKTLH